MNRRAGRTVAVTAHKCLALKSPSWGMKLIFICHRVYQSGLGLQAEQMNFGKLKGIYGSAIRLLTEPKGRLAIQVPKMHGIQGQPGSRQNPAPSSTWPSRFQKCTGSRGNQEAGRTQPPAAHGRRERGCPKASCSPHAVADTALGSPGFLQGVAVFLHYLGSPIPSRGFSFQMFNSANIFLYIFWVSYHTYKATSPLLSCF